MPNVVYSFEGREWACGLDPASGRWFAETDNPRSVISAEGWGELVKELQAFDPAKPRIDAVAVCQGLRLGVEGNL